MQAINLNYFVKVMSNKLRAGLKEIYPNRTEDQIEYLLSIIKTSIVVGRGEKKAFKQLRVQLTDFVKRFEKEAMLGKIQATMNLIVRTTAETQEEIMPTNKMIGMNKPSAAIPM